MLEIIIELLFNKYLLSILYEPDTVLDAEIAAITKKGKIPAFLDLTSTWG